ncbi:AraC family transcriptional regulator [Phormidium tenue FACHB-886]|nr:AraC family transcriptional regulator [Phormidium tenue FACHB-886]
MEAVSESLFAIVVQGRKKISLNEEIFQYGVAQYFVISVDLPLSVCMVKATSDHLYLRLKLNLDPVQLCEIIAQTNQTLIRKRTL